MWQVASVVGEHMHGRGMCTWQGACMVGAHMHGRGACVAACPSVNRMTDRCKTLPCRNLVAGGNNTCLKVLRNV